MAKKATKKAAKKPAKKAPAKKAPAKKTAKAAKAKPKKKPAKRAPEARSPKSEAPEERDIASALADLAGRAMIVQIVGDAEAYFFDFDRLGADKRGELIEYHLAAFDRRKRAEGKADWAESFVPVALLGESMPPPVRTQFDLSAPHEGVLLYHRPTGALLHASSKDDEKLAVLAPDLETISPIASYVDEVFDPAEQTYAYAIDRSQSEGFTRSNIELLMQTSGAELMLV